MFTWLNKQGVRSDEGFELQFTGRFTAEYRESGRTTKFYVDGGSAITVYEGSLDQLWRDTPDPTKERARIIRNLNEALAFQGLRLDLVEGPEPRY